MVLVSGTVQESVPTAGADASQLDQKVTKLGSAFVAPEFPDHLGASIRGTMFRACNPTPGTGIAMAITTAFSATAPLALIRNKESSTNANAKSAYLRYVRLVCTAAGASTTSSHIALMLDPVGTTRYSSGGTTLTPVNANSGYSTASICDAYIGAITATAASGSVRQVARAALKTQAAPCWTVGDELILHAAGGEWGIGLLSGSAACRIVVPIDPVVIAPTHSLLFHMWNVANATTPPSWECEFCWQER